MPDQSPEEKREFVRAPVALEVRAKWLAKEETDRQRQMGAAISSLSGPGGTGSDADPATDGGTRIAYLTEFMFQINEKLDRIIEHLEGGQAGDNSIQVLETVNISGSGVSLLVATPMKTGDLIDLSLVIPEFPMGVFSAQGEVIRVQSRKGDDAGTYEIGVKFMNLNDEQRERLIAYTFRQQRRTIRQTKEFN